MCGFMVSSNEYVILPTNVKVTDLFLTQDQKIVTELTKKVAFIHATAIEETLSPTSPVVIGELVLNEIVTSAAQQRVILKEIRKSSLFRWVLWSVQSAIGSF